jgi:hypothetical protein
VTGVKETETGLGKVAVGISPHGTPMRSATLAASGELARALASAANGAPTPQAALLAGTVHQSGDGVKLGGSARVGHRGTPARELVAGSEHGGKNFAAAHNAAGYWIAPTVEREKEGRTKAAIQAGVDAAIVSGGFG